MNPRWGDKEEFQAGLASLILRAYFEGCIMFQKNLAQTIRDNVHSALTEDIGTGDLTANLIPADAQSRATIMTRQQAVLCGSPWFEACF